MFTKNEVMRIIRNQDESGNKLEKHFRELKNLETEPPGDVWERLEYRLDEERARVKHDHWYKALIVLLVPFTIINILITYDLADYYSGRQSAAGEDNFRPFQKDTPGSLNKPGGWGNFLKKGFLFNRSSGTIAQKHTASGDSSMPDFVKVTGMTAEPHIPQPATEAVSPGLPASLERKMLETSATLQDVTKHHSRKVFSEGAAAVKGFHVGIEGGVNNNWLLHKNNTLHPLIGNRIHRKFDAGVTCGISAGYDFSSRYGVEAEFIFQSPQGQQYRELRYGKIMVNGEVNLEYMQVPVMFKYKWTRVSLRSLNPRVLNLAGGIQYSRLRDAEIVQNGQDIENVRSLFNRDELGLLLGLEYDIFLHQTCFLSMGMRASISTDARAFPYFNSEKTETYNALIGLNASLNYLVKRKKKAQGAMD